MLERNAGRGHQVWRHQVIQPCRNGVRQRPVATGRGNQVIVPGCGLFKVREEIPSEHARFRRDLIVDPADVLLILAVGRLRDRIASTPVRIQRGVRKRHHRLHDFQRHGIEQRGIDLIVDKRRTQRAVRPAAAGRRHHPAEVALEHLGRRHEHVPRDGRGVVDRALNAGEEKQPIVHDGPPIVPPNWCRSRSSSLPVPLFLVEERDRIEPVILHEIERVSMKRVRA